MHYAKLTADGYIFITFPSSTPHLAQESFIILRFFLWLVRHINEIGCFCSGIN